MTVGLCLLVWNERHGCEEDVPRLPLSAFDQVFAMDGGSTDGTVEYLQSRGIDVVAQTAQGYNAAYLAAFRYCRCEALVIFPPKGNIDPDTLRGMRAVLDRGVHLVIASRMIPGAANEEDARLFKPRKRFVQALGWLAAVLWKREGYLVRDILHGYRAMRCDSFWAVQPLECGLTIDLELVVGAYRLELSRSEIPVRETVRVSGATHFRALPTGWKMLKFIVRELRRNRRPAAQPVRAELR